MIEVKNLTKKYGPHLAVDDLSFTVEEGQIYGFLGPNGAGKSTTMNIMTGYIGPTSGQVIINGYDILEEPQEAKSCIGFLPEQPPLYMDMTVLEYLKFVAELKRIPRAERWDTIEEAMQKTGIIDMADRLIKNLSKGYRQRVGLAQALVGMPPVIILDEPTVGLDPKQIIEIRELIKSLGKKHTVILSSHIMQEISAVCDHIMIINRGRLVASGTPEELQEQSGNAGRLHLTVKGAEQDVRKALADLPVKIRSCKKAEEPGVLNITASVTTNGDIRADLFAAMAEAKLPILEMSQEQETLEKLFIELTEGGPKSAKKLKKKKKKKAKAEVTEETEETSPEEAAPEEPDPEETVPGGETEDAAEEDGAEEDETGKEEA